ncbi:MAG: response regulator [Clostridiales bacterium]|jgi:two-component system response regulator YesN|nr:response regulator [Clostridiales bacterium]
MLKVFLVEDEFVVRRGIRDNIDWASEGFLFSGEAADGELAFPLIQREKPDIIITDIRMPFMDGLDLSRLIRKELPHSKIIILSGHEEFSYAQKALNLGVAEYILKPVSGAELIESVKNVARQIYQERKEKENIDRYKNEMKEEETNSKRRLFEEMVSGSPLVKILERGKQLGLDLSATYFQILLFKYHFNARNEASYTEDMLTINEKINRISAQAGYIILFDRAIEGNAAIIKAASLDRLAVARKEYIEHVEAVFSPYDALRYFGGVGKPVGRLTLLSESFESAARVFSMRFMLDKNAFVTDGELDFAPKTDAELSLPDARFISEIQLQKVGTFLKSGEKRDIPFFVEEFLKSAAGVDSRLFRQYVIMDIYFTAVWVLKEIGGVEELKRNYVAKPESISAMANSATEIKDYILGVFNAVIDRRDEQRNKRYSLMIRRAKEYIAANYANEDISLNDTARYVNISPSYFSALFSRETGRSFINFLTECRMNKAKELLRCSDIPSSEVSAAVGYKDPHYFSYLFKKTQHCTPMQFRSPQNKGG